MRSRLLLSFALCAAAGCGPRSAPPYEPEPGLSAFAGRAVAHLETKQAALRSRIADAPRFDFDQAAGTIRFSGAGPVVIADIQDIGSLRGTDWEWAWSNPSVLAEMRHAAFEVKRFAEANGYSSLLPAHLTATEEDAWEFAAIAAEVSGAEGVYRAPTGDLLVFFLLTNIREVPADGASGLSPVETTTTPPSAEK